MKPLTPLEEQRAREGAFKAFAKEMHLIAPPAEPQASDYIHENQSVVNALKRVISILPAILGVIAVAAILISADKTFSGFRLGVANKGQALEHVLGICGVVMTECGLIYVEFAIVRERLKKGLARRVFNFKEVARWLRVVRGTEPPRDYSDMPDASLIAYSRLIFAVVLGANAYGAYAATVQSDNSISTAFALVMGIAGAFSLRFIGAQLAHITYEIMEQERRTLIAEFERANFETTQAQWALVAEELNRRAMHRAFVVKNELEIEAGSPYLLQAGEDGELEIAPFAQTTLPISSRNE